MGTDPCPLVCFPGAQSIGVGFKAGEGPLFLSCVSPAPKVKRSRLEAARRLNFRSDEMEELLPPDSPTQDITPPPSPEVPAELWGKGCVAWGTGISVSWKDPVSSTRS